MNLEDLLKQKKADVIREWIRATLGAYPADAAKFYERDKDPFANPVGASVSDGIHGLFDALFENVPMHELSQRLERIIQVGCVQEFPPSQAVSFVFLLKGVIRELFARELENPRMLAEWLVFETRIDRMAACAFDVYTGLQKRISEIRIHEIKSQVSSLLKRSGIGDGDADLDPNHEDIST